MPRPPRRLRVIAGEAGGRRLATPPGIRPTTDRVREALFSALGPGDVRGAAVLDLYAGSGALGIEALSRGAARALLVDHDRAAAQACRDNLESTGLADRGSVRVASVDQLVGHAPAEAPFDLVLADPPYETERAVVAQAVERLAGAGWLSPGALVVVEGPAGDDPFRLPGREPTWERRYGDTLITIVRLTDL